MSTALTPPIRPEYENRLAPFTEVPVERPLPLATRVWAQDWVRKAVILVVLAVLWELAARWQNNELLLPTFTATMRALVDGLASGELLEKVGISLVVLVQGYVAGVLLAFALTTLAVSTQIGRDLLGTLTSMFNPLPAIALLPLALLWFGLGLCLAHADCGRAGVWGVVGQGRPGLVHLPEPQRAVYRPGVCRAGDGGVDWVVGGEPGVCDAGALDGAAVGAAAVR